MNQFDWDRGFALALREGAADAEWTERHLSAMRGMFADREAYERELAAGDPLIYRFHELGAPKREGDIAFGITELYPGTIGGECYMTKGHFHRKLMTAEIYLCLSGQGVLMLENPAGDWQCLDLRPMEAVYVPRGYAHRSINTGEEVLRLFFAFEADAGHDYGTIEDKGYRHLVYREAKQLQIRDNPRWIS